MVSKLLLAVSITLGTLAVLGVTGDYLARQYFGVGLFDLLSAIAKSGATLEGAASFDTITPEMIGNETYNKLLQEKNTLVQTFSGIKEQIQEVVNSNPELTESLKNALGENYSVYLFSVYKYGNLTFKVFEWSVGLTGGNITLFDEGKVLDNYNVLIQMDHSIASDVLSGNADTEKIAGWITQEKIKINPITEVTKVTAVLPAIINAIPK